MNFTEEILVKIRDFEQHLDICKPNIIQTDDTKSTVVEAMKYSLLAGGKRIRPILLLEVCKMLGGNQKKAMDFAVAIECIHTYSLIHDDLPCMDNDTLRRGKPTCHIEYDEATALLAGDSLLNLAFEIMANANSSHALRIIRVISKCSGISGMIGGQELDLSGSDNYEGLMRIHTKKTCALIEAAVISGAMLGSADITELNYLKKYAFNLGIAFQIRDDLLDEYGSEFNLGKNIGSDKKQNKVTFLTLLGKEKCEELLFNHTIDAQCALDYFSSKKNVFLKEYTNRLALRNR